MLRLNILASVIVLNSASALRIVEKEIKILNDLRPVLDPQTHDIKLEHLLPALLWGEVATWTPETSSKSASSAPNE